MDIKIGKVIELENGNSYLVGEHFMYEDKEYLALFATTEPVQIKFAEIIKENEKQQIIFVEDMSLINTLKNCLAYDLSLALNKKVDN